MVDEAYDNDYEIILIADGCNDTVKVYQELVNNDNKDYFTCLKINKQKYLAGIVRQTGIDIAKGEYIIYLDSDDYYGKNHLKKVAKQLDNKDWVYMNDWQDIDGVKKQKDVRLQISSSGTSSICHKRLLKVSWKGLDGYAHDFNFIKQLMNYSNYKKIFDTEYYIKHIA